MKGQVLGVGAGGGRLSGLGADSRVRDGEAKGVQEEGLAPHLTHLKEGGHGAQPETGRGRPSSSALAAAEGPRRVRRGQGVRGVAGGRSVVELALTRLVDEAALVLGPARTALSGAVLPLHHLGAQRMALGPLPGPLQPPRLARLLQQHGPRRQRSGGVVQGPGLAAGGRQLPVTKVAVRQGSVWVRGRGPRLQHYGAAGDVNGHAGVLDEEVLQGAALEAGGPEARPLCSKTGGRGNKPALVHQGGCGRRAARGGRSGPRSRVAVRQVNDKPAVHLILLRDEGAGALGVFRGWGSAEEEAGEALEHRGRGA